jgi:hypothetical protein
MGTQGREPFATPDVDTLLGASQWLQNPTEASGIVVPSATWTLSDKWSAVLSGYLPFGTEPVGLVLHSQYGASTLRVFAKIRAYW